MGQGRAVYDIPYLYPEMTREFGWQGPDLWWNLHRKRDRASGASLKDPTEGEEEEEARTGPQDSDL